MTFGTGSGEYPLLDCAPHTPHETTHTMSNSIKRIAFAFAATALVAFGANAQQASGNIAGTAVTGDTVLVTGTGTGFHRELKIEKDGKYQLRSVPLGEYVVSVTHADGTAETPKGVAVRAGSTARVK